jgi:hypothetical protein
VTQLTVGLCVRAHHGRDVSRSRAMIATRSSKMLKLGAVAFTVLWTLWILSWSGSFDRVNVILPSACGAIVGYAWYRAMRW